MAILGVRILVAIWIASGLTIIVYAISEILRKRKSKREDPE